VGVDLAYLHRAVPRGLADAIDAAFSWVQDRYVCLALPDTIFRPVDAIASIRDTLLDRDADVVLGVFPTDRPQELGPVRMDADGRVTEVLEKPPRADVRNTWGVAVWAPAFTSLLRTCAEQGPGLEGLSVGSVFNRAIHEGLKVHAVSFAAGSYIDFGTKRSFQALTPIVERFAP
jgi:glucose-1-phosphate thymidylyltransferase